MVLGDDSFDFTILFQIEQKIMTAHVIKKPL